MLVSSPTCALSKGGLERNRSPFACQSQVLGTWDIFANRASDVQVVNTGDSLLFGCSNSLKTLLLLPRKLQFYLLVY